MTTLKLTAYSGEVPRTLPRLLPDTASQRALNVRLDNGGLTPTRQPRFEANISVDNAKTIYKHNGAWLAWQNVVHAAPGPVAQDRLYYMGDGKPKMIVDGTTYDLAVPMPTAAPALTVTGTGTGNVTSIAYVYTFVTAFGEESEPSALSNVAGWQSGQTRTLTGIQAPPAGRNITKQRFYRSQTGSGGTDLFFIEERAASAANFVDTHATNDFGEMLPSLEYNAPPDGLKGLISLPNGMMAAFTGKDLYFCEPFIPHAWPEKYILTMDYQIVALGAYGTTIVVMTEGLPYIVSGTAPENMQQQRVELNLPCINARGVIDLGYSVAYPSHDGLVMAGSNGMQVITEQLMTRNDWMKTGPGNIVGGQFNGRYFASYEYIEPSGAAFSGTLIFDTTGAAPFIIRSNHKADAFFHELQTGALYFLVGKEIFEWDALGQVNETLSWRSKQFVLPMPTNFGAILIEGSTAASEEEQAAYDAERQRIEVENATNFALPSIGGEMNGAEVNLFAVNGDMMQRLPAEGFVSVSIYADGKLVKTVSKMNRMARLPSGFLARIWEIEVNSNINISDIVLATTGQELRNV
ncbi:virion-associated phage protein [Ralstonia phage GP4]|uniref:Virion-associated phage protein n=2 Tax=Caudoviricetes TaxID=2731619 RepID=A0A345GU05_9CAUD|nr:internal virion protein [Ralstonia phage GP4]8JOV_A Chain A, Virion-associated phage protein [Ralstonia phage GP4]8JOV_B Chain B, Virion-associated phage protein [Ralstonia phage GP4]8JOV_C Chain C, Virion-associated phage protein [Ralstonia phage GP4]8JOV_D Chain D, Virion-associated phage protein [Ralstonia phage GP4]8JOV_E Chain E, Virion-associated phage protein [Ralstonia phage GP4]8JOV_F Chain F, Virion-associated phage protein [Ralstonia phage GP4]AXG67769.1 virion-associated phage